MSYNNTALATATTTEAYQKLAPGDGRFLERRQNTNYSQEQQAATLVQQDSQPHNVALLVVRMLENLGIESAHGVAGGAMATLWEALSNSLLKVLNHRHETGAAFAATEAYFVNNRPTVVFTTTGPGITNALTGLLAARGEGAKVILITACTSAGQRGRWAIQETSTHTLPSDGIFTGGALFNYATIIESAAQLPQIFRRLALGLGH